MDTSRPRHTTSSRGVGLTLALIAGVSGPETAKAQTGVRSSTTAPQRETEVILVTGGRAGLQRTAGSAHLLGETELERFEYDDIQRVLTRVPGVYVRDEDGFGLRPNIGIRGASSERSAKVVLLEDGVLLGPAPYAAPQAYFVPLATRMTGLEVFKGPAAVRTGPFTVGGAINYLTADIPQGFGGVVDLAAGQFGYLKGHARFGWSNETWGVLIEGVRLQSSGFKELDGGGNTGFEKSEVMAKARWGSDPTKEIYHRIDIKAGWADELSNETYLGLSQEDFDATPFRRYAASRLARMEWERTQLQASYGFWWGEHFEARLTGYRHDFTRAWLKLNTFGDGATPQAALASGDPTFVGILRGERASTEAGPIASASAPGLLRIGTNDRTFVSQGVQLDGEVRLDHGPGFGQEIRWGVRVHYDEVARDHTEQPYQMVTFGDFRGDLVLSAFSLETTLVNLDTALAFSAYIQDEIELFDNFLISPGVRLELISLVREQRQVANDSTSSTDRIERDLAVFVPGLGVFYQLSPELGLLAGVHRGFSPVSPGNPEPVQPELSINYEAGARLGAGRTTAELIGFFNDYSNLLLTCTFSSGCPNEQVGRQFNAGTIWIYGLEASAHHDFLLPAKLRLSLDARYTLTLSEFQDDIESGNPQFESVRAGDRLPYLPEHQANLTGRIAVPLGPTLTSLTLSYTFVDRMRDFASAGDVGERRGPLLLRDEDFSDAQHLVDLSLQFDLGPDRVYLRIDDLFDQVYVASRRPFGARPGRPFTAQIGYTHRFGE